MQDIIRYPEPVVLKQYRDYPPHEPRLSTPDTTIDAGEIERLARAAIAPAIAGMVFIVAVSPVLLGVLALAFSWAWQVVLVTWVILVTGGAIGSFAHYYRETKWWIDRRDEQVHAGILYMESKVPPRVEVERTGPPIIYARPVAPRYSPEAKHEMRLAYWVRRAVENKDGKDGKPGPRIMRHDRGEYSVIIKETGEEVDQKTQETDYAALVKLNLLTKTTKGYQIADPTWTIADAAAVLKKALRADA